VAEVRQRPAAVAGSGFAALLGAGASSSPALAFNRSPGDTDGALAFAAMPIVAPVAIALAADARLDDPIGTKIQPDRPETAAATAAGSVTSAPADVPLADPAPPAAQTPSDARISRAAPTEAAPARGQAAITATALRGRTNTAPAALPARSKAPPARMATTQSLELALGAGISVRLLTDESGTRVLVRGVRLDGSERGETTARVARLLRGHGHIVSEQSIAFEGGGQ